MMLSFDMFSFEDTKKLLSSQSLNSLYEVCKSYEAKLMGYKSVVARSYRCITCEVRMFY